MTISSSETIECVTSAKILGLIISSDLKWKEHIEYIYSKATSRIWTLRRLKRLGFNDSFIIEVYKKEIRPVLEYASPVWNGALTASDSDHLEKVQKLVLRLLLHKE